MSANAQPSNLFLAQELGIFSYIAREVHDLPDSDFFQEYKEETCTERYPEYYPSRKGGIKKGGGEI
jgi:hypothetical protein